MVKPACVPCGRFFRPERNGELVAENKPIGGRSVPPGLTEAPKMWTGYKIWRADIWRCQGCGTEIIVGYSQSPVSQDYHPDFKDQLIGVEVIINDC